MFTDGPGRRADKARMPAPGEALPGRATPLPVPPRHLVHGRPLAGPWPAGLETALFGLGCFWGAERLFWQVPGVWTTAAGYAAGFTPNPTYEEVCTGHTGHNEVVLVVYDPAQVTWGALLALFWEAHDPTQGMRQGNDIGTQYRSGIYANDEVRRLAAGESRDRYATALARAGFPPVTTEIGPAAPFYYAEAYHQQYLARNPDGYCGLRGTGIRCAS